MDIYNHHYTSIINLFPGPACDLLLVYIPSTQYHGYIVDKYTSTGVIIDTPDIKQTTVIINIDMHCIIISYIIP